MGQKPKCVESAQFFALPRDERLRDFGTAWLMMRRDRRMPRRRDLDPITFARVLPYVLLSCLECGLPVYELAGEAVNAFYDRRSIVGLSPMHLVNPGSVEDIRRSLSIVRRYQAARYSRSFYLRDDGVPVWAERLLFPLSDDDESVAHTISIVIGEAVPKGRPETECDENGKSPRYWITV